MACLYDLARIKINRRCDGYYLRWYYNGWHYWLFRTGSIIFETEGEKYRTLGTQKMRIGSGQITEEQTTAIRTIMNSREVYIYTDSGWGAVRVEAGSWEVFNNMTNGYDVEITIVIGSKNISSTGFSPAIQVPSIEPSIIYCELDIPIAGQIWMCKNWDINLPGSKVYNDDEDNRSIYGGLYLFSQIKNPGFCPNGWHVPTRNEWHNLIVAVGGVLVAGGELKEIGTTHWNAPNVGAVDTYNFTALPAGSWNPLYGYIQLWETAHFWCIDEYDSTHAYVVIFQHDHADVVETYGLKTLYNPVRLIRTIFMGTPVALAASSVTTNSFISNWNHLAGATGYHLTVATDAAFTNIIAGYNNLDVGYVTSKSVTGLMNGVEYYYRIRAYNGDGNVSEYSNVILSATLYGFLLTTTGTGLGVASISLLVSSDITISLDGTAKFYSDVAGTLNESSSWVVTSGAVRTRYIRCPSGTSNMTFSNINSVTEWGSNIYYGWVSSTNAASISGSNFLLPNVVNVYIIGNNTFSFNVNTLPVNMIYFRCLGSNTITGTLAEIPANIQYINLYGNNTLTGNLSTIPATLISLYCYGLNTISGDIIDIPATCTAFSVGGNNTINGDLSDLKVGLLLFNINSALITGDFVDIPNTLTNLYIYGNSPITGDLADLSANIKVVQIENGTAVIIGDLSDLQAGFETLTLRTSGTNITGNLNTLPASTKKISITTPSINNITGTIVSLPATMEELSLDSNNTVSGDPNDLPLTILVLLLSGLNTISIYTSGHVFNDQIHTFILLPTAGSGLDTAEVDNLLIDLDGALWNYSSVEVINIAGNNAARSAASDVAVLSLQGKGVTVTTN